MTSQHDKPKRWQWELREMFVAVTFAAITISLIQLRWYLFVPLIAAICFELCGWHSAARMAAVVTIAFWVCCPCLWLG
jgi:hypothetical protein